MNDLLLDVIDVGKTFVRGGLLSREKIVAVNKVSVQLSAGRPEILAIIGESGSGKTTLARMILNMETPTSGRLLLDGIDLAAISGSAGRLAFMHKVQPIFQNPFESFNPLKRVERYLLMTRRRFAGTASEITDVAAVDAALHKVGLSLKEVSGRYPHELSGGQLQRVAIARALLAEPKLVVADEPVSMIDASLRMSIVNLFRTLRDELGISIIYVTHDLATAYYISDRIVIMQKGSVVESGDARAVLRAPRHPYTHQLREAVLLPEVANVPNVTASMNDLSPGAPERRA
ncbi:ABC transporter ATP-binding protein [Bradyrhizobium guangzhouense]|uniref:ABC transporter ATP-binding protein n=1 Tax=Bradyrhizobium guangzhouense TaxID=1325095 RepID=A0AAE5WY16_9BRAD|nr:ABC transporter ATP-binding protein [Bradyrhizobium guangzhouense]QAU45232.1 ABC transporter ATP-binding protein [Bradyrhizobium guangzhouense]RXH11349.1 ABC transporter ATP-binding protein [Bradyrhizobium guangzhouense]RXH12370.1 ABC transporter ATP-binding protein [Bradyrhizobium guangzhouense]